MALRKILQKIIQKKNPSFKFDESISNLTLLNLLIDKSLYLSRGLFFCLIRLRRPCLMFIGRNVKFFNSYKISVGQWTRIENGAFLSGLGKGKITIGKSVGIGAYSQIIISTSFNNLGEFITIGKSVGIGQFASIGGSGGVTIGDNCIIGQYFSCHPENHNYNNPDVLIKNQGTTRSGIKIGENCWIGAKVTILAGVSIGEGCVIAAGSVVTKSMPPNSIIGGIPAKVLKPRFE